MYEEASQTSDADLKKIDELDHDTLNEYDKIFIGSPIHAGSVAKEIKEYLKNIPRSSSLKLAGFITHAAPAYPQQTIDQMAQPFIEACKEKEME